MNSHSNFAARPRPRRLVAAAALVSVLLFWVGANSAQAHKPLAVPRQASTPTPTPTPAATRQVGWLSAAASRSPAGLQRTVVLLPTTGGGEGSSLCPTGLTSPAGQDVWMVSPGDGLFYLGAAYHPPVIRVDKCGGSDFTKDRVTLIGPDNRVFICAWPGPPEERTCNLQDFYGSQIPAGTYLLVVASPKHTIRREFRLLPYPGHIPWMRLSDAKKGEDTLTFVGCSTMQIDLRDFEALAVVELRLYRYGANGLILADTWQVKADDSGRYRERLQLPEVTDTDFLLLACPPNACDWWLAPVGGEPANNAIFESFHVVGMGR
jgi:hypothetical protein